MLRLNKILILGSIIILLTSGLGLYSLSSFLAIKRTKDFSIRRVFGASRQQVVLYHISDFLKLSIFATIISGWVIAYFIALAWLDGFTYRTNIKLENFIITIILNVAIVLISVIYHSIKISNINPAVTLKSED
ncbi:MAG: FtsX-like permease family protein [Bacteroidota bacterium]